MICLKNGRRGYGQADRDLRTVTIARDREKHTAALRSADAAWECEINRARPGAGGRKRETDYPTAVRAAASAWDREMENR